MKLFLSILFCTIFAGCSTYKHLSQGDQSLVKDGELLSQIRMLKSHDEITTIKNVLKWKRKNFKGKSAQGKFIGKRTAEDVWKSKFITGCHDDALIVASVLRELKIPTVMIESTGISWSESYLKGKQTLDKAAGHVFIEVRIAGSWMLLDSSYELLIEDYDRTNLVIPIKHQGQERGYYVMARGKDSWDYGIHSLDELLKLQIEFSTRINYADLKDPKYNINKLLPKSF